MNRTIFILGRSREYALQILWEFRSEFGEYVEKYNSHTGEVILHNGLKIVAISVEEERMRTTGVRNFAVYGAEYFMELCYKNGYHALKSRLEKEELIVPVKDLGMPEELLEAEFKRIVDAMKEAGERASEK